MQSPFTAALVICLSVSGGASAGDFFEMGGVAIMGYDPVAYFTKHQAITGSASYTYSYQGSEFRFVSAEDRDLFAGDPGRFAPQYHGFCTFGVSEDVKVASNPAAFRVVDGKLYLNYDADVARKFDQDVAGNLARANQNWPSVQNMRQQR